MRYDNDFSDWWFAYPRRIAKKHAHRAWMKATLEIADDKGISIDAAIAWLLKQTQVFAKSDKGQSGRFCPHPATWLNQGRYDDDPKAWNERPPLNLDEWKESPWTGQ